MNIFENRWRPRGKSLIPSLGGRLSRSINSKAGFTLIEVLVTVVVLSVGILGVTAMQTASVNGQLLARNLDSGFNVVHDALDRMQANSAKITDYIKNDYGQPFMVTVDPAKPTPPLTGGERPTGAAGDDYDALYRMMYEMKLRTGVLRIKLTNDFPVSGVDLAEAKLTWNYKGAIKKCEVTTILVKRSRK